MSMPRAPAGPRTGFARRNRNPNHAWQSADRGALEGDTVSNSSSVEDLRSTPRVHASAEHARAKYNEVKDLLHACPFFVLDLVEGTCDVTATPREFPNETLAIIITCTLSRKASVERCLLKLRAATRPIIVLCVEEDTFFHTDDILDVHGHFLELGASDTVLQCTSVNLRLDLFMRVQSARCADQVRQVEVGKRLEDQQRNMVWPFVHRIMEGFPKLSEEYDSQIASRKIVERMQAGTFGTVYKCVNVANGQLEVMKSIPKSPLNNFKRLKDVWKEIVLLQRLEHPNVVACNGSKQTKNEILIFMDYAGQHNLLAYLRKPNRTPSNESSIDLATGISIIGQLLAGLAHCHENGVAHRDVKPENIVVMVTDGVMKVRIVDFGLATESTKACTDFVGTVPFAAPEVATKEHEQYDPACADIWSCGVVFLEILCGVGKINRMLRWSRPPSSPVKYREDLEKFFSIKNKITASVEADVALVGDASFPGNAHLSLLGMLTPAPRKRWNAATTIEALKQDTAMAVTAACDGEELIQSPRAMPFNYAASP